MDVIVSSPCTIVTSACLRTFGKLGLSQKYGVDIGSCDWGEIEAHYVPLAWYEIEITILRSMR
jgi:hypothetical protein